MRKNQGRSDNDIKISFKNELGSFSDLDKQVGGWMVGWVGGCRDKCISEWMDGYMDVWLGG
jgi:hypothetical protein